ncbi:DUF2931 family protein [Chryseobacterium sp. BIGb0232]|uniref:DUF2931 family protein n=1 Tax=Chryseobacterium sp. BIGb0232 TaxID=2940598 RepID=UPI000F4953DB|nr:DUF2931 family protein [Chryseobacterium sp. BIGb0232]MCS4302035.1 hypothetical protein [Chryseobacterium sp. BIGb0232]ROS17982.1 DUF2931 family protein [Chryseobacterium nakagawai]
MKKTAIDYLNFGLAGIFIGMLILYGVTLLPKKEQEPDKFNWSAKIISMKPNSVDEQSGMLKILDAIFINSSNQTLTRLDHYSPKSIFSQKGSDSAYFWTQNELLPDSLYIKYFSVEESKFYQLNTRLPLEKMHNSLKNKDFATDLKIEIQQGGKISLKIEQPESENFGSKLIHNFQAKEIQGTLKMLVYGERLENYDFSLLKKVSDYSDLIIQKYVWKMKVEIEGSENILETSANTFEWKSIRTDNKTLEDALLRNIPKDAVVQWENEWHYHSYYAFDGQQILDAFKELNKIKSNEPAIITFKIFKNTFPKAEISKAGKTIKLKNIDPNIPIKIISRKCTV